MMKVVELSGGVGGARLARGLARVAGIDLTVVVNVGDDDVMHGLYVSPDLDTVVYTLSGIEGNHGWGRAGDSFTTNAELGNLGADNRFRLGDRDLAMNILRTEALNTGETLSEFTGRIVKHLGITHSVVPSTNQRLATRIRNSGGETLSFQEYFVLRQNRDVVEAIEFDGADKAIPAPGVIGAINDADLIVFGPSNPPLSIWPILAVEKIRAAVERHPNVVAVSPLFGGKALKGPADRVMASLGLPPGNVGVAAAYVGLINLLIVDEGDAEDARRIDDVAVMSADTRIADAAAAEDFARKVVVI
jgi:LPPG:FO 2-phospho-L-lactate transferase